MPDDPSQMDTTGPPGDSRESPVKRIGDFDLLRQIGRGGMGVVFEARQVSLNRRVALKLLPPGLGFTDKAVSRFKREAQAAAGLHHTNIVPVYAIGEEKGSHYYAMELIEGQSLAEVLRDLRGQRSNALMEATVTQVTARAPSAPSGAPGRSSAASSLSSTSSAEERRWCDTAAHLIAEVADALHYAHSQGIVHRDIKPANLMLSRAGRLCLTDFGLARITQEPTMTLSGLLMGSPAYMSPEQVAAGRITIDHRTDVYSLGVVLYEMLTFRLPFLGDTREVMLTGIMTKEPPRPRSLNPRVPLDLETICLKAMEKDPDRRYATAGEMAEDLRRFLQRGLIAARRAGPLRRLVKLVQRHPTAATALLSTLAVVTLGVFAWIARAGAAADRAEKAVVDAQLAIENGDAREGLRKVDVALAIDRTLPEARLLRARLLLDLERAPEAVIEARDLLRADPDNLAAHLILARAAGTVPGISRDQELKLVKDSIRPASEKVADAWYYESLLTEDEKEAVALLDRALDLDPGHAGALAARGSRLSGLKRFQEALGDCDRLISARPRSAIGRRLKADVLLGLGDDRRARAEIDRAIEMDRGDSASFVVRGRMFCTGDRKSLDAAFADLDEAIRLDPGNGRFYDVRAWCNFEFRRDERAIEDARRAIALGEDRSWITTAYSRLASALHRLGREPEAREAAAQLQAVIETWPDARRRSDGFQALARLYENLDDSGRALELADKAVEASGGRWGPLLARARIRSGRKDEEGKNADCRAAAAIEITHPQELNNRAIQLRDTCGRFDLAVADHSRAIELAPAWGVAYLERGWTEVQAKEYDKGLADYARCIEIAPNLLRAYNARAFVLMSLERWEEALRDFDRSLSLEPNRFAYCNRGIPLQALGRLREMKTSMEKCLEFDPRNASILTNLGLVSSLLGQGDEAIFYYQQAIEADPKSTFARVSLASQQMYAGRCDEAAREIQAARDSGLDHPVVKNNLAFALLLPAHRFCPRIADNAQALRYARELSGSAKWEQDSYGTLLGMALYRNGTYQEGRSVLEKEVLRGSADQETALLVLAMIDWKLGRKTEARGDYDRALQVIETKREVQDDPDLKLLLSEAKNLILP